MYRDNSLIPSEAIRLLALGLLAEGERSYADLASEIRHFTARMAGPSLDLVGTPLELLKVEGLIAAEDGGAAGEAQLRITESGRSEVRRLLAANVRAPVSDVNKLILAVKLRFLDLLPADERALQVDMLAEMARREVARLKDLHQHHEGTPFADWLNIEIRQGQERLAWFERLAE